MIEVVGLNPLGVWDDEALDAGGSKALDHRKSWAPHRRLRAASVSHTAERCAKHAGVEMPHTDSESALQRGGRNDRRNSVPKAETSTAIASSNLLLNGELVSVGTKLGV